MAIVIGGYVKASKLRVRKYNFILSWRRNEWQGRHTLNFLGMAGCDICRVGTKWWLG